MARILYLYPEEWTGTRAREIHTLETCLALADAGQHVTFVTAGGFSLQRAMAALGREFFPAHFEVANLSRHLGPIRSAMIFGWYFSRWMKSQEKFDLAYIIHLKATPILRQAGIRYVWEAHEIFAETPPADSPAAKELHNIEKEALTGATAMVATSQPLADALNKRYFKSAPRKFFIVPHGCSPPIIESLAHPHGPFVYAGSIADWKGLPLALEAAAKVNVSVKIIGGMHQDWNRLTLQLSKEAVQNTRWKPRVAPGRLMQELRGARAGLCPTLQENGSGRYSLPMKIFDYARCGLPVVSADLASLRSMEVGKWCRRVKSPDVAAWAEALSQTFDNGEEARDWAVDHTWKKRGELLAGILGPLASK